MSNIISNIIYEITISCQNASSVLYFYNCILRIRKEDHYLITIEYSLLNEHILDRVKSETEAFIYLHKAMKLAMRSKILYKFCERCQKSIYFPNTFCGECFQPLSPRWLNNYKNEKITEHIGLKMKWNLIQA